MGCFGKNVIISVQNCVHAMKTQLPWHVKIETGWKIGNAKQKECSRCAQNCLRNGSRNVHVAMINDFDSEQIFKRDA